MDFDDLLSKTSSVVKELDADTEIVAAKLELAEQAAEYWRSVSPEESGEYIASVGVHRYGNEVYVEATDPIAHIIEFGSVDTPEFAPRAKTEEHFQ